MQNSSYEEKGRIAFQRYVLFQAKLIKDDHVRIPIGQLRDCLRSSWHSSFYAIWRDGLVPRCIPASLVDEYLQANATLSGRSLAQAPSIKWEHLSGLTDTLPAFLGDRFLCGEVGDPLRGELPTSSSDIARRVADLFGRPRFGVFTFRARVGIQSDGVFTIAAEPQILE